MPPLIFEFDKGVSNQDETRLPQGFATLLQNWIYDPDDRDRIFKIFGRERNGSLPSVASPGNTFGFTYLQFENTSSKFVLLTNSSLYETDASSTVGTWTQILDKQDVPVAFPVTGTYLKSIATSDNRYIVFDGTAAMRPLVRDEDGDWHYLGMNPAAPLTMASIDLVNTTITRPVSSAVPVTVIDTYGTEKVVQGGFTNPATVYDTDLTTYATAVVTRPGPPGNSYPSVVATDWAFSGGVIPANHQLSILASTYVHYLPPNTQTILSIYLSLNGGTTYTYIAGGPLPVSLATYSTVLTANGVLSWSSIKVRVCLINYGDTFRSEAYVGNISAVDVSRAGTALVTAGTYWYAQTESYEVTLASGQTITTEGPPSQAISITLPANTAYGVSITLPAVQDRNTKTDGYKDTPTTGKRMFRTIYRSTSTGSWPDLGRIGTAGLLQAVYIDSFIAPTGTTIGSPSMNIVFAGVAALAAAQPPPPFLDAVLFRSTVVCIPALDPYRIEWSLPGFPDYWPMPAQDLSALPTARNDKLLGLGTVGEYLVLFTRTRLLRMRSLPFVDRPSFDPDLIQVDILSPNEGLAGGILSNCTFQSQKGFSVLAWVSDSGIWMTDGSLPNEGGLGIVKLTANLNWRKLVDPSRLTSSRLIYDPVLQMVFFDYYDTKGNFRTLGVHTAPDHWVPSGQDHTVPKISGPHTFAMTSRIIGELDGVLQHWALDTTRLRFYNERVGRSDDGQPILSVMESGWQQPGGPQEEYLCSLGSLYHSDWGPSETCALDLLARRDDTGVIREMRKSGLSLAGAAAETFYIHHGSKSFKVRITHNGLTTSNGQVPIKALGPVGIDGEVMDSMFGV